MGESSVHVCAAALPEAAPTRKRAKPPPKERFRELARVRCKEQSENRGTPRTDRSHGDLLAVSRPSGGGVAAKLPKLSCQYVGQLTLFIHLNHARGIN